MLLLSSPLHAVTVVTLRHLSLNTELMTRDATRLIDVKPVMLTRPDHSRPKPFHNAKAYDKR